MKLKDILNEINKKIVVDLDLGNNALFYLPHGIWYGMFKPKTNKYTISPGMGGDDLEKIISDLNLSGVRWERDPEWKGIFVPMLNPEDLRVRRIPGNMTAEVILTPEQMEIYSQFSREGNYKGRKEYIEKIKKEQEKYGLPRSYPQLNENIKK